MNLVKDVAYALKKCRKYVYFPNAEGHFKSSLCAGPYPAQ